ncbi:MAG: hypothetical protein AAGF23_06855, partial [Acidobacteriota bacterium]
MGLIRTRVSGIWITVLQIGRDGRLQDATPVGQVAMLAFTEASRAQLSDLVGSRHANKSPEGPGIFGALFAFRGGGRFSVTFEILAYVLQDDIQDGHNDHADHG